MITAWIRQIVRAVRTGPEPLPGDEGYIDPDAAGGPSEEEAPMSIDSDLTPAEV
jgi:hypothetical protein